MSGSDERPTKVCPYCGETILEVAVKCRFCQSDVATDEQKVARLQSKIAKLQAEKESLPFLDTMDHDNAIEDAEADIAELRRKIVAAEARRQGPPPVAPPPSPTRAQGPVADPALGATAPPSAPNVVPPPAPSAFTAPSHAAKEGQGAGFGTLLLGVVPAVVGMAVGIQISQHFQVRSTNVALAMCFGLGFGWFTITVVVFSKSPPFIQGWIRAIVAMSVLTLVVAGAGRVVGGSEGIAGARAVAATDFRRIKMNPAAFLNQVVGCRVVGGTPDAPEPFPALPAEAGVPIPPGSTIGQLSCGEDYSSWPVIVPPSRTESFLRLQSGDVAAVRLIQPFARFSNPTAVLLLQ